MKEDAKLDEPQLVVIWNDDRLFLVTASACEGPFSLHRAAVAFPAVETKPQVVSLLFPTGQWDGGNLF